MVDWKFRIAWDMPVPAINRRVEGIGRADLLRRPELFESVYRRVMLPFLAGARRQPG